MRAVHGDGRWPRAQSLGEVFLAPDSDAPGGPEALAYDGRHIWVARPFADAVVRISASSGAHAGSFSMERPGAVLLRALRRSGWPTRARNSVVKLSPWDGKVLGTYPVGHLPAAMVSDGEHLWVANSGSNSVTKLDRNGEGCCLVAARAGAAARARVRRREHLGGEQQGAQREQAAREATARVLGVFPAGDGPSALAFDGENIWVANYFSGNVMKLRAADGAALGTYPTADGAAGLAFDGHNLWVTSASANRVIALRRDGSVMASYATGQRPHQVLFDGANIWLANTASDSVSSTALGWR